MGESPAQAQGIGPGFYPLGEIRGIHPAHGNHPGPGNRALQGANESRSQNGAGKGLHHVGTHFHGADHFARGGDAGYHRQAVTAAGYDDLFREVGGHDERGPGVHGHSGAQSIEHRARADKRPGMPGGEFPEGVQCSGGRHGYFQNGESRFDECPGGFHGALPAVGSHDAEDHLGVDVFENLRFKYSAHYCSSPCFPSLHSKSFLAPRRAASQSG